MLEEDGPGGGDEGGITTELGVMSAAEPGGADGDDDMKNFALSDADEQPASVAANGRQTLRRGEADPAAESDKTKMLKGVPKSDEAS
jgi:hypothetical protein